MYEKKLSLEEIINPEHFPESFLRKKECRSLLVTVSGIGYMAMAKLASVGIRFYGVHESYAPESCYLSCRYQLPEKHALYRERNKEVEVAMIFPDKSMAASLYMIPEVSYDFETITDPIVPGFKLWPCKWITYSVTDSAETVLKGLDYFHAAVPRLVRSLHTRADQCMRKYISIDKGSMYIGMDAVIQNYLRRIRLKSPDSRSVRVRLMDKFVYAYVDNIGFTMYMIKGRPGITMTSTDMAKRLSPHECDMVRRFMVFCKEMPKIEHLNNAARDALFELFVKHGIDVLVCDRHDDGITETFRFVGNTGRDARLSNCEQLYKWTLEAWPHKSARVTYGKCSGKPREFPGDKTRELNADVNAVIQYMVERAEPK